MAAVFEGMRTHADQNVHFYENKLLCENAVT